MGRRLRWTALLATTALALAGVSVVRSTPHQAAGATTAHGLSARYFDRQGLTDLKLTRTDPAVNFEWGRGSPSRALGSDTFSARWHGELQAPASGGYSFFTRTSDGVRLWVDGKLVVD